MRPDVTEQVTSFYDRYPYPPPARNLEHYRRVWQDDRRRRSEYSLLWPFRAYTDNQTILIAGCGTSQAVKYAMRWPASEVTAIDVSATSVRCTRELQRTHGLSNLQVHQLPIEHAHELGTRFDQIVCTGVLHHLANPDAGLAALRDMLAPCGAMHLMVYAPYGRAGVYMLQEFCRRLGIRATDDGIRDLVAALRALPSGHPLEALLRHAPDFRDAAALADALLHPQDRAYSVPQLLDFIERAGLRFGRWVRQAAYSPRCGSVAKIPQASRMTEMPMAAQCAAVELFRGTMIRHSLVAYEADVDDARRVAFDGDGWRQYVPIRMPETLCVMDRVPPGAAAVLINQAHTYTDLFLPINVAEKRLFDAIDGRRSVEEIVTHALPTGHDGAQPDTARTFFERLWWYDQVVFDASRIAALAGM